ncbi:hypothetical protein DSCO28_18660 [Desulfosarcina ovata subsp. sediminis]|uniref:Uncharacterized protein n=1 Tax=Desulfosarcina ovata subsp. sediminis TaxID=885957 RepID=A0A5K7ZQ01_9BACT|nr:hypothetical protein DSCO28_18660 [Desulfosarcina ovata subsp. sediminis]
MSLFDDEVVKNGNPYERHKDQEDKNRKSMHSLRDVLLFYGSIIFRYKML